MRGGGGLWGYFGVNFGHLKSEVFQNGGGGYFEVNFGHLKSKVFRKGGGGAFWSEIPKSPFLENLDKNLLFEVNCTQTCLCITDSLSHTTYVETNDIGDLCLLRSAGTSGKQVIETRFFFS